MDKYLVIDDFMFRPALNRVVLQALQQFYSAHGSLPKPYNEVSLMCITIIHPFQEQANEVLEFAKKINASYGDDAFDEEGFETSYLLKLIKASSGSFCPLSALIGGLVANQCITAISGKWTPLNQWLFFDAITCLPENLTEENVKLVSERSVLFTLRPIGGYALRRSNCHIWK